MAQIQSLNLHSMKDEHMALELISLNVSDSEMADRGAAWRTRIKYRDESGKVHEIRKRIPDAFFAYSKAGRHQAMALDWTKSEWVRIQAEHTGTEAEPRNTGLTWEEFFPVFLANKPQGPETQYIKDMRYKFNGPLKTLHGSKIQDFTNADFMDLYKSLEARPPMYQKATLGLVRNMINSAAELGLITNPPVLKRPKIHCPRPNTDALTVPQYEALLAACKPTRKYKISTRLLCLLAGDAGLRAGEIAALEWREVDLQNSAINVRRIYADGGVRERTKGRQDRTTIITERLAEELRAQKERSSGPYVLGKLVSNRTVSEWMQALCRAHKLRDPSVSVRNGAHAFRHTFVTRLAQLGFPLYKIQELSGHKDLSTLELYLHTTREDVNEARALLNALNRGQAVHAGPSNGIRVIDLW